jgi:DNA-binding CsgD family transcriptional regulator
MMAQSRPIRSTTYLLLGIMLLQFLLAAAFVSDFVIDYLWLRETAPSYTFRELMQIAGWLGLLLAIVLNGVLLRMIVRRGLRLERTVRLASGAFQQLLDRHFEDWGLTPSERDVALLAIKGFSNGEIAGMLDKSEGTVKAQSNAVFRKAGVSGRVQLMSHFMDELIGEPLLPRSVAAAGGRHAAESRAGEPAAKSPAPPGA